MKTSRYNHGLWWDAISQKVLTFGGKHYSGYSNSNADERPGMLKVCEEWDRSQGVWQDLPSMHYVRSIFNPCEFHFLLYLCGYGSIFIEVFNPATRVFAVIASTITGNIGCITTICEGQLVLISASSISFWGYTQDRGLVQASRVGLNQPFSLMSNMAPLVDEVNGVMYVVASGACYCIHLESGTRKEVCS